MRQQLMTSWKPQEIRFTPEKQARRQEVSRIQNISYNELRNKGYKLVATPNRTIRDPSIRTTYLLSRDDQQGQDYGAKPANIDIQYDFTNDNLRIIQHGKMSYLSKWVHTRRKPPVNDNTKNANPFLAEQKLWQAYLPRLHDRIKAMKVNEVPLIITPKGDLVCMQMTHDIPVLGLFGGRGMGKSYAMHSLIHGIRNQTDLWQCFINDSNVETYHWMKPMQNPEIARQIRKYGMEPTGLPMQYFIPSTKDVKPLKNTKLLTMDFQTLVTNYDAYLGSRGAWKMTEQSGNILRQVAEAIGQCKEWQELEHVIYGSIDYKDKGQRSMADSVLRRLRDLVDEHLTPIATGIDAKETVQGTRYDGEYTPFMASMIRGNIPSLITNNARDKPYFGQFLHYVGMDIFEQQTTNKKFRRHRPNIMVHFDELSEYSRANTKGTKGVARDMAKRITSQGRPNRIGFTWATQLAIHVDEHIWENTDYLFMFQSLHDQAKTAVTKYYLDKSLIEIITHLPKRQCVLAIKGGNSLVVYDNEGNRYLTDKPQIGTSFPCVSDHKRPNT